VDGYTYNNATRLARRSMLPRAAGIYIWTTQLARLWDNSVLEAGDLLNSVEEVLKRVREIRFDQARVGPYRRVQVYDDPVSITSASVKRLGALIESGPSELSWVLMCATLFQRPLYIGKTLNFQQRIRDHFDHKTTFGKALRAAGVSTTECSVALCPITIDGLNEQPYGEQDDEDMLSVETNEFDEVGGFEEVEEVASDVLGGEAAPPDRDDVDRLIRLAESLVIRTAHPIFNEKMD